MNKKVKEEDDEEDEVNYVEDVKAEDARKIVEDYILYNFPEEDNRNCSSRSACGNGWRTV